MSYSFISVIMPVYNNAPYIADAIESILNQSYPHFEFIIIDDASTDNTVSIIEKYCFNKKIIFLKNEVNEGISNCLNKGMLIAKGDYIVRMDGDDISILNRLEKLVTFMESHSKIDICGSSTMIINEDSKVIGDRHVFVSDPKIKIALLLGETSMAHSSVIMRKNFLFSNELFYDSKYDLAEDYELFCRGCKLGRYHNIDEFLLQYRVHSQSVSRSYKIEQRKCARKILEKFLFENSIFCSNRELDCHMQFALPMDEVLDDDFLEEIFEWKEKLKELQEPFFHFDKELFSNEIEKRYQCILLRQKKQKEDL